MHPDVCAPVSALSYDGELAARRRRGDAVARRGRARESRWSRSTTPATASESSEEAAEVVRQVSAADRDVVDATRTMPARRGRSTQSDFLVVAPYNAQRQLIRSMLTEAGLPRCASGRWTSSRARRRRW